MLILLLLDLVSILMKLQIVYIIQVLSEEQKCPLLGMYCLNISVTGCHLVHYKTKHVTLQRYLFLVLPKGADETFDRMGQYDRGKKPIRFTVFEDTFLQV